MEQQQAELEGKREQHLQYKVSQRTMKMEIEGFQ